MSKGGRPTEADTIPRVDIWDRPTVEARREYSQRVRALYELMAANLIARDIGEIAVGILQAALLAELREQPELGAIAHCEGGAPLDSARLPSGQELECIVNRPRRLL